MIHNLDDRTVYSLNGVFWTLAIEEQLYLLYFLLIYLRDRWRWRSILLITFLSRLVWLGIALTVNKFTGFALPFSEGSPANWWIWVLGALAVEHYYGIVKLPKWCASFSFGLSFLVCGFAIHLAAFSTSDSAIGNHLSILIEPFVWGCGFFILVVRLMQYEEIAAKAASAGARIFRVWAGIGVFSYSLYLTHECVIRFFSGRLWIVECGLCLLFAYLFYLIFERPFIRKRRGLREAVTA